MPLLRKQPFHKVKPQSSLLPDDEVFHCSITNEIFKTYEEFFERTILCNSLVWSCALTGRSGLTYAEALESERAAEKRLATFDLALQKPLLYLVTLTQKSRIMDLCEDVFQFANDRYFIGESVDVIIGRQPMPAVILRVQAPPRTVPSQTNGEVIVIDEDSEPEEEEREVPPAGEMMYVVALSSNPSKRVMVKAIQISRKKGSYTRDRNKLFLKHKCHSVNGIWRVKETVRNKMQLAGTKFEELFAGPRPKFAASEKRRYYSSVSASSSSSPRPTPSSSSLAASQGSSYQSSRSAGSSQDKMLAAKKPMQKQQERNSPQNTVSLAELQQMKQQERLEKLTKQLAMKKKFEEERQRLKEEKERQREEREKERLKKLEEKKKKMEEQREWSRPREDMECDDLKPLPELKELKTRVSSHLCGDALMVLEYVNAFKAVFDFEQFFPNGFSWDDVESAVMEADQQGPLCDLLQMLLCTVFNLQETEAGEVQAQGTEGMVMLEEPDKKPSTSQTGDEENGEDDDQISNNDLIRSATMTAQFSMLTFGVSLKDTTLDQYTLTEILRLHLASSGADANQNNARFRYQQRGGYSALDDPGLELRKQEPALMKKLQTGNVFDLTPDEKLKLVTTLVQQVMSYAAVRDMVEDAYDKLRIKKYDLKILQWSEARRIREAMGFSYRHDLEEKIKEHKYRLQEMTREDQIKKAIESGLPPLTFPPLEDPRLTAEQKQQQKEQEEEEERKKKEDYVKRDLETQKEIMELQQINAIYPLGRDRLYRRYWYFSSLPAVLVEDHELFLPFDPAMGERGLPAAKPAEVCDVPGGEGKGQVNREVKQEESPAVNGDSSEGGASLSGGKVKADVEQTKQLCEGTNDGVTDKAHAEQEVKNGDVTDAERTDTSDSKQTEQSQDQTHGDSTADTKEADKIQTDASDSKQTEQSQARGDTAEANEVDVSQKEPRWYVVHSKECLDQLISSLNPRGFRESALQAVLLDFQRLLHCTMQACPVDKLHQASDNSTTPTEDRAAGGKGSLPSTSTPTSRKVVGSTKSDAVSEILELTLRDGLLDIEGRIYAGGLGAMRVKDRTAWRAALENGGYSPLTDEAPFARVHSPKKAKGDTKAAKSAHIPEEVVAKDLAHALVQIARGVDLRYLKPPFECQRHAVYERWEESALASSSLSQVFLHLSAFDKSIKWNRSTLKMRCRVCRRMRDDDKMLLCDKCDRGHHIYCLKPPLTKIPSGDWFCYTCRPKTTAPTPRKRRQNFDEEEEEVESEEYENSVEEASDDEEEEEMEESEEAEEIPNEDVCAGCGADGVLILCDVCPRSFHLHCAQPPLRKVPKGKWMCHVCVKGGQPGKLGKSRGKGKHDSSKKGSPYTPASGSSKPKSSGSSRQQTPRSSPTPTSGRRKPGSGHSQKSNGATGKQQNTDKSTPKGWTNGEGQRKRKASSLFQCSDEDEYFEGYEAIGAITAAVRRADQDSEGRTPEEQMQAAEAVLKDVMEHEDAWPFLKPVDKKVAPDYYQVIETPMDLSTIRSKLRHRSYSLPRQLFSDVRLIFANCIKYNLSSAPVYQAGQALSKYFQSRVGALGFPAPEKSSPSLQPSPGAAKKQRR